MRPSRILALALLVASPGGRTSAEPVQFQGSSYRHPGLGYAVGVPSGWKADLHVASGTLEGRGPGGLRLRVDATPLAAALGRKGILKAYRRDALRFQEGYGKIKVLRKPHRGVTLGGEDAVHYAFAYRERSGALGRARIWLATGPSNEGEGYLLVKVLAYGPARALSSADEALGWITRSVEWPGSAEAATPAPMAGSHSAAGGEGRSSPSPSGDEATLPECGEALAGALEECRPFACRYRHPLTRKWMRRRVVGKEGSVCRYSEEMPNGGRMECGFSEEQRRGVAAMHRPGSGGAGPPGGNPLQAAMGSGDCRVEGYGGSSGAPRAGSGSAGPGG